MARNRLTTIIFVLILVIGVAFISWLAGSRIQSPAEAAARTAPPAPSPILVPVEERVLSTMIVTRGTARFGLPQSLSIVPSALTTGPDIFTLVPAPATQIHEGDRVFAVSGRPVIVLQGNTPVYRDFVLGIQGDDVRQIEAALARLGFDPGPIDGVFDAQTSSAVDEWYTASGWQSFGPTANQLAQLRTLEQQLSAAENARALADDVLGAAPLAVDAARAAAESANQAATSEVAALEADPALAAASAQAERDLAQHRLAAARAAADQIALSGAVTVQAAVDAQRQAEREAALAAKVVVQVSTELEVARAAVGVQIPASEIIFIPTLPARVESVNVMVGDTVRGPVMTVTNNQVSIDSSLPLDEAPLVKPGMAVVIDEPELGIRASGIVDRVASTPGTNGADGFHVYFEIQVVESETELELQGFSLRLTIPVQSTAGAVTAVPVSALSLAADGTTRVQVEVGGDLEYIVVEPGLSAQGYVEVTAVDGSLLPGQLVLVGYESE